MLSGKLIGLNLYLHFVKAIVAMLVQMCLVHSVLIQDYLVTSTIVPVVERMNYAMDEDLGMHTSVFWFV